MTLQEFLIKYNGKFIEVSGSTAQFQCVDLANLYIRDVLGLPMIEWTNAVDFPKKADSTKYDYILNTPTNIPQEGDLIIWGGTYGHIAIFIEGNVDTFKCFEQNNPLGTNCHVGSHGYSNVLGWLHPKAVLVSPDLAIIQNSDSWIALLQRYNFTNNKDIVFAEVDKLLQMEDALRTKDNELQAKNQQLQELQDKASDLEKRLNTATTDLSALKANYTASQKTLEDLSKQNDQFRKEIDELKDSPVVPVLKTWDYFKLFLESFFKI